MPEFKNKEEYEKWKAQRLEDIKSRSNNTSERSRKDEYPLKTDYGVSSSSSRGIMGKIIIVSLIFLVGILFYSLLSKDRKHDDTLIPKSQAEPDAVKNWRIPLRHQMLKSLLL